MAYLLKCLFLLTSLCFFLDCEVEADILCEAGYCADYILDTGCAAVTSQNCQINNATHTGLFMLSPTICNCCDYCLPFYGENEHCSLGGAGDGTTIGRCGDGLYCEPGTDGNYCQRMDASMSECHGKQDEYDERHETGETGALEQRPLCDGKGKFAAVECVPTQTCFCQSEDGERIFGEALYQGTVTQQNMQCGCSRLHQKVIKNIDSGLRFPTVKLRCTADGNFNPVQCIERTCYCVNTITGAILTGNYVDLDEEPITELPCYDPDLDLYPDQSQGDPPYNYTTPCYDSMQEKIRLIEESEELGYNIDYFSEVTECSPDGSDGHVATDRNGTKICVDSRGIQLHDYHAEMNTPEYDDMDCKCAVTAEIMASSTEKPVCCQNGNFRPIQCRRGTCRCVDSDGRQVAREAADVTTLECYTEGWRTC